MGRWMIWNEMLRDWEDCIFGVFCYIIHVEPVKNEVCGFLALLESVFHD